MNKTERALLISESLDTLYPNPPIPLKHESIFTLLIAVILSAQCTDIRVNKVPLHCLKGLMFHRR